MHIFTEKIKIRYADHIRAAGRAFGSWHEFGLALPPNTMTPQGLADILERDERESRGQGLWQPVLAFSTFWKKDGHSPALNSSINSVSTVICLSTCVVKVADNRFCLRKDNRSSFLRQPMSPHY